jgi:hypothetical protein
MNDSIVSVEMSIQQEWKNSSMQIQSYGSEGIIEIKLL